MSRLTLAFALVATLLVAGRVSADPTVEVRSRLRLELDHATRAHRELTIEGRLLDEGTSEPQPVGTVAIRLGALDDSGHESTVYAYAAPVDVDGAFRFVVSPVVPRRYVVHLSSGPLPLHDAAAPIERELDLARRPIELRLFAPPEAPAGAATLSVSVEAVALDATHGHDGVSEDIPVALSMNGVDVAVLRLEGGHATTEVPLHAKAGQEVTLTAKFEGDDARGPAEATARVRLVEPTTLTLVADNTHVTLGAEVKLRGVLRFGERTVGGLPIVVHFAGEDSGVTVDTSPTGTFEAKVHAPSSGTRAGFEATFRESDAKPRGLPPATSAIVIVELTPGFSLVDLGTRPAGAALGIAGALLVVLALLRVGAIVATRKETPPKDELDRPAAPLRAPRRAARDRRLFGRIFDDERRILVIDAHIEMRIGTTVESTFTDSMGAYQLEPKDGAVILHIEAPGFAPQTIEGNVPHRGEWAPLDIRLVPLRAEVLRRYGAALAVIVPSAEKLGLRTPRELALLALRHRPSLDPTALRALRGWVEAACFGAEPPSADSLSKLAQLVDAARLD